jgi:hypothetical protein
LGRAICTTARLTCLYGCILVSQKNPAVQKSKTETQPDILILNPDNINLGACLLNKNLHTAAKISKWIGEIHYAGLGAAKTRAGPIHSALVGARSKPPEAERILHVSSFIKK